MFKPIRCFTCGALVAEKYTIFNERIREGAEPSEAMNSMKIDRYCCRRMLLSNIDTIDQTLPYYEYIAERRAEFESNTL